MCRIMSFHKRVLRSLGNGPARRSLFGPVDREQLQSEYRNALQKDLEDASLRWGFDFVSEKPLNSGDFQWEGVPGARVPALYRSCIVGEEPVPLREESTSAAAAGSTRPTSGKENVPKTPERCNGAPPNPRNLEKTPEKNNPLKRKQTNITDCHGVAQNGSGSSSVTSPALVLVETPNESVCGGTVVSTKMNGLLSRVQKAWCPSTSTPTAPSAGTVALKEIRQQQ
ncbi:hypothetical protein NFI96_002714 [Prochilodus magdalenae]|nr:hypothetical protein NFI96_002714 [Prochilodus magdalenae]